MTTRRAATRVLLTFTLLSALTGSTAAFAAVPATAGIEGVLTSASGGPAADGNYALTFTVLDSQAGKTLWTEGPVTLPVKAGQFSYGLGSTVPLTPTVFSGAPWLQIQVGSDPVLPSVPLRTGLFAVRASVADSLECSGCLKAGSLDAGVLQPYAKTADLAPFAKSADLGAYAKATDLGDYVKAAALAKVAGTGSYLDLADKPKLADVATSGAYGDLLGIPTTAKLGTACGTGLVMRGIKADGSYDCTAGGVDAAGLPKDGLDEVSNGTLSTQFLETAASAKTPIDIPDNLPAGISDALTMPDFGSATSLTVSVELSNSDISKVRVTLYDPNGLAYKLHDQTGSGTSLKGAWPAPNKLVTGDLAPWLGKSPKGIWSLNVADLSGTSGGVDGKILAWSVQVGILSDKKVKATVPVVLANSDKEPFPCDATVFGAQFASPADKAIYICNGTQWYPLSITAIGTKESPTVNCKDLLTKAPLTKSGVYWVDPDGAGQGDAAYQAYCDMATDGGGWTLVWSNLRGGSGKPMTSMPWTTAIDTTPLFFKGTPGENLEGFGVYTGLKRWPQLGASQLRFTWSSDYGAGVQQSYRCNYSLTGATYVINFTSCTQLVGGTAPGLVTYHGGRPFTTYDSDHDAASNNCSTSYSNTPFWYGACWDGSLNGGGENSGGGHYNGAYWVGSAAQWGTAGGVGAGNGWIFVR